MSRKKKNQDKEKKDANVHKELKGLDININPFGEIETNFDVEKINQFLNKHVEDKKLKEREEMKAKGTAKESPKPKTSDEEKSDEEKAENSDEESSESGEESEEPDKGDDK